MFQISSQTGLLLGPQAINALLLTFVPWVQIPLVTGGDGNKALLVLGGEMGYLRISCVLLIENQVGTGLIFSE